MMSNTFFLLGILVWLVSTGYKLFVWSRPTISRKSIWESIKISFNYSGVILTFSIFQLIGGFWVLVGIFFLLFGEELIVGFTGSLIVAGLFLLPIWTAAVILERKNKRK